MVGMTVGFTKTNRHPLVVLYEGRNAVGFLSIFCTNQPVGIGLVDSWTSPRGAALVGWKNFENFLSKSENNFSKIQKNNFPSS